MDHAHGLWWASPSMHYWSACFWVDVRGVGIPVPDICFPVSKLRSIYRHYKGAITSSLCICTPLDSGQLVPAASKQLLAWPCRRRWEGQNL